MSARRAGARSAIKGRRPSAPKRGVVRRPKAARSAVRRGASARRAQKRQVRRQQARKQAARTVARPRPVARPRATVGRTVKPAAAVKRRATPARPGRKAAPTARKVKRATGSMAAAAAGAFLTLNAAKAAPELSMDVSSLQSSLEDLQGRADMSEVQADIAELDANLNHALSLLESARDKGYMYEKDLEDIAYDAMSRWQSVRADVEASIGNQAGAMQSVLQSVDGKIQNLNQVLGNAVGATSALSAAQGAVSSAMNSVYEAERTIGSAYSEIETAAYQLTSQLTRIHWGLTQLDEATFELGDGEDLVRAVAARWDKEGKDDPEGILFLTNKRLIFERKEKVATKKVLFVTTASELVQEVALESALGDLADTKAHSKGLFGHQDFLNVGIKGQAVPFHLNGQDSDEWGRLIKDAKSGKIEEDRATGSGLSFSDLTGTLTEADILDVQNEVNELQDEMMLKAVSDEISELENRLNGLTRELADVRGRGYNVEKSLEADIQILASQWEQIKTRSQATLTHQTRLLSEQMGAIQKQMSKLAGMSGNLGAARPTYVSLKSMIAAAEAQAEAAEETVLDQYDEFADEVLALDAHLEWVDWMLDALETASFSLLATENGVAAVEAVWERPGMEPENGILFLTDQRLIWEDRVGDFEIKLDIPVGQIEDVKEEVDEESGDEDLVMRLGSEGPMPNVRFGLNAPVAEEWLQMIGRAKSGGFASDMAVEVSEEELDRIRNAPTQCSNCGAAYTAPVLRGQTEIACEFCGVVVRI